VWRGFESLVIPFDCNEHRTATKWCPRGPTRRRHIGLENVDDLKADLERGFAALKAAAWSGYSCLILEWSSRRPMQRNAFACICRARSTARCRHGRIPGFLRTIFLKR
jgi:hypothetical protein